MQIGFCNSETKAILEDDLKQVMSKIECTETELSRKKIERKNMELEFENCKEEMNIEINDMISSVQNNVILNSHLQYSCVYNVNMMML